MLQFIVVVGTGERLNTSFTTFQFAAKSRAWDSSEPCNIYSQHLNLGK